MNTRNIPAVSAAYFSYFALLAVMMTYMARYFVQIGFSASIVATAIGCLTITKLFVPFFWGSFSDRIGNPVFALRLSAVGGLVVSLFIPFVSTEWSLIILMTLLGFFYNGVLSLIENVNLLSLGKHSDKYSKVRLWGSVGYILGVCVFGWLTDFSKDSWKDAVIILFFVFSLSTFLIKPVNSKPSRESSDIGFLDRFRAGKMWLFFICVIFSQAACMVYYIFFDLFLIKNGVDPSKVGFTIASGVLAEVFLFFFFGRQLRHAPVNLLLTVCLVLTSVRWLLIVWAGGNLILQILIQTLHALTYGGTHAAAIHYLNDRFPMHQQGRAQAIYSAIGYGLGGVVRSFLAGFYWSDGEGSNLIFYLASLLSFVAAAVALFIPKRSHQVSITSDL